MNNNLEEKFLLLRAKKYLDKLKGITDEVVYLDDMVQFKWHKSIYNKILKKSEIPKYKINLPMKRQDLCIYIQSKINLNENDRYYMFFEIRVIISFIINKLCDFLHSYMFLNNALDMNILSLNPNRVIDISEDEYDLNIYDISES
ncbi:hypothetical protein AB7044_19275 [Providencia stuartii]|uniref:hypothetical protein n=1 Tax=Providencia stuartii TaxID=588 RepID=UPI0034E37D21